MEIEDFDQQTFTIGDKDVPGKKILEKFEPEHVVVYQLEESPVYDGPFLFEGTDHTFIRKQFPEWEYTLKETAGTYLMYSDSGTWLDEFYPYEV